MSDWNHLLPSSHTDTFTRDRLPPRAQWPVFIADRPELNYPDTARAGAGGRGDRKSVV